MSQETIDFSLSRETSVGKAWGALKVANALKLT